MPRKWTWSGGVCVGDVGTSIIDMIRERNEWLRTRFETFFRSTHFNLYFFLFSLFCFVLFVCVFARNLHKGTFGVVIFPFFRLVFRSSVNARSCVLIIAGDRSGRTTTTVLMKKKKEHENLNGGHPRP